MQLLADLAPFGFALFMHVCVILVGISLVATILGLLLCRSLDLLAAIVSRILTRNKAGD